MSLYDSWYLRAVHPRWPLGIWIRHTFHQDARGVVRGARWFTLFEPQGVEARKASFEGRPAPGPDRFAGEAGDTNWDVRIEPLSSCLRHLPAAWMYRTRLPKTKPVSVYPLARIRGEVNIGDKSIAVDGWPGMVGHNWGVEHAHRWIWLHAAGFDEEPEAWLDMILARLKIGRLVTPWLANGAICLGGERHRIGGFFSRARVDEEVGRAEIILKGRGLHIAARVTSPGAAANVLWRYSDPDGTEHIAANCSIASLLLRVARGRGERVVNSRHGAAYELGMRERPSGYAVQPYPDP